MGVAAERDVGRDPATSGDDAPLGDPVRPADGRHRMDERRRLETGLGQPRIDGATDRAGTDADHETDVVAGVPLDEVGDRTEM